NHEIDRLDELLDAYTRSTPEDEKGLEAIRKWLEWIDPVQGKLLSREGAAKRLHFNEARRVAATWVVNPEAYGGESLSEVADKFGFSKALLSKYATEFCKAHGYTCSALKWRPDT